MALELRWGVATDPGRIRTVNEDSVHAEEGLWIVADGVGGHAAGEVASQVAVEFVRANTAALGLAEAVRLANRAVLERAEADVNLRGMGTTVTAVVPVEVDGAAQLEVVNVGDSRAYLFRDGELLQLTEDHSLVAELEREGRITADEARVHPQRNIVTRVLGNEPDIVVDVFSLDPFRGDRLVLCSDGLSNELEEREVVGVLAHERDPIAAAGALVDLANVAGGRDNITVVVIDVVDDGDKAAVASAQIAGVPVARRSSPPDPDPDSDPDPDPGAGAGGQGTAGVREGVAPAEPTAGDAWSQHRRLTWRATAFLGALVAIVLVAVGGTWWVARSTYFVGLDGDDVVIYRGRPGGVLFIDPTLELRTGLTVDEIPASRRRAVEDGKEAATLDEARDYVANLEAQRARELGTTTTTTTTSTSTTVPTAAAAGR
ncbi:MAG: protein phosphatase 2C domain-containing protein [Acidimicrobiia bacterium]